MSEHQNRIVELAIQSGVEVIVPHWPLEREKEYTMIRLGNCLEMVEWDRPMLGVVKDFPVPVI
jgi:hypothetical protein